MAISQDQFFEQYWPSSNYYQQLQEYAANARFPTGKGMRGPTGGEIARMESQLRSAARGSSQFQQSWSSYDTQQQALAEAQRQQEELERQRLAAEQAARELAAEQARIQAQLKAEQEAISKQQIEQAAAIEAQLAKERRSAEEQQAQLKLQFEAERAKTEELITQSKAETQKQQIAAKREAALAVNVGKKSSLMKLAAAQTPPVSQPQQRKKTLIGQPGISSTRFSARAGLGGYSGTAAGRVNPTGLNI